MGLTVELLDAETALREIGGLAEVLVDCVAGGASVSFMLPFGRDDGVRFFREVAESVQRGETLLFAARLDGRIVGTVQVGVDMPPNQPHRGDLKKLLVHRAARRQGVAAALMEAAETAARRHGRTLLVLDTASGEAERVYERGGWQKAGTVPDYALLPAGGLCATTFYWKRL